MSRGGLAPADRAAPAGLDEELRAALRQVPASVAIVTTGRGTAALGMTATSVTPVSLAPPALLVCVNRALRLNAAVRANTQFQISYLRRGQENIACAFAGAVAGSERFRVGEWNLDASAGADLPSALIGVSCRLETSLDYGSHSIFIGRVEAVRCSAGEPLLYCGGQYSL